VVELNVIESPGEGNFWLLKVLYKTINASIPSSSIDVSPSLSSNGFLVHFFFPPIGEGRGASSPFKAPIASQDSNPVPTKRMGRPRSTHKISLYRGRYKWMPKKKVWLSIDSKAAGVETTVWPRDERNEVSSGVRRGSWIRVGIFEPERVSVPHVSSFLPPCRQTRWFDGFEAGREIMHSVRREAIKEETGEERDTRDVK
jgi:hypothetical protein